MSYATRFSLGKKFTVSMMALMGAIFVPKAEAQAVLFVSSSVPVPPGDSAAVAQIQSLGYSVAPVTAAASQPSDTAGKALVVISSSVTSADVGDKFRTAGKPVVTWESALFDNFAMVGAAATNYGTTLGQTQVVMSLAGHRLAAGLTGTQTVFTSGDPVSWGIVPATALKIATQVGDASHAVVFGYEAGTAMVGLTAPARRVGLFLGDAGPSKWTAQGSSLFRAAILWAAGATDPRILVQPQPATVNAGQPASFTSSAAGAGILAYQWRKNGANIPGATAPAYLTPAATPADNGAQFSVAITGANGTQISANALLTVNAAPVITTQPANDTVAVGQTGFFAVVATGSAPLAYQWKKNGIVIAGATAASYTTPPATTADNFAQFTVTVSNGAGSVTSAIAVLVVTSAPPVITTQPVSISVPVGKPGLFSVAATGSAPLTYQWRKNGVNIPGATSASYMTPPPTMADSGAGFSVAVSNPGGTVISNTAILTVFPTGTPPFITTQPASVTVPVGGTASLTVVATGTAPLSYVWTKDSTVVGNGQTLTFTNITQAQAGSYQVRVTNTFGSVLSNIAVITVVAATANTRDWMTLSGELFDAAGNPVGPAPGAPVATDMEVRLYKTLTGDTAVYAETFFAANGKAVPVADGYFAVRLGQGTTAGNLASTIANHNSLYAEIRVGTAGSQDVLAPRTPLTAAPFAIAPSAAKRGTGEPNAGGVQGTLGAYYIDNATNATWIKTNTVWVKISP